MTAILTAGPAAAHGTERGFILLLPTNYYLVGGAAAVAASFLLLTLVPTRLVDRFSQARLPLGTVRSASPVPTSLAAFAVLCVLLLAGLHGSRDPLANPLPLAIWTLWWVGLTLLHSLVGNVWVAVNPWTGPYRLLDRLTDGRIGKSALSYPKWFGYLPAIGFFLAFAGLELVYPAPDDPEKLAHWVAAYWVVAFAGMVLFGEGPWTRFAEPFSIFFRLVARLSPLVIERAGDDRTRSVALGCPGSALIGAAPLPLSGVVFVLTTLACVSFDGLSKTFWWLALNDINPLEFPGRTAMVAPNTLGLLTSCAMLTALYAGAIWLGSFFATGRSPSQHALGALVYAIVPISIGFHVAHYLSALLVEVQYALIASSDPFGTGVNLFGFGDFEVTMSFLNTYSGVRTIWNVQTAAIVAGHVVGVAVAHAIATKAFGDRRAAVLSQVPLAVAMVLYTGFGLWLLSTPIIG